MSLPVLTADRLVLQLNYHCMEEKLKDYPWLPGLLA